MNRTNGELHAQLQIKSREELLALLEQLMQQQPGIEPLMEVLLKLSLASHVLEAKSSGERTQLW